MGTPRQRLIDQFDIESRAIFDRLRKHALVSDAATEFLARATVTINGKDMYASVVIKVDAVSWFVLKRRIDELSK